VQTKSHKESVAFDRYTREDYALFMLLRASACREEEEQPMAVNSYRQEVL